MHVHGCTSVRQKKKTLFLRHNLIRSKAAIFWGEQFDFIRSSERKKKNTLFLRQNLIRSKAGNLLGEQFDFICVTLPKKVDNLKEERE